MSSLESRKINDPFQFLKARYGVAAIIIAWYWQPGTEALTRLPQYWEEIAFLYYGDVAMALFLVAAAAFTRLDTRPLIGRPLRRQDLPPILLTVVLTFFASMAIVTLTMVPLSYLFPEAVTWWLAWYSWPSLYITEDGAFPLGPNILSFVSLVVLAPLLEESLFRGYLLHRWARKWGLWTGVLLSSALFGAIHPDVLAAAVTGLGFAVLYLKTQSLWAPIAAHAVYNFVVWLWELYDAVNEGADYYVYTIDELRDDLWWSVAALILVVVLMDRLLKGKGVRGPFVLPGGQ